MNKEMQLTFKAMSKSRGLWHGAKVATHQDLSALFVARTIQLYLKPGGHFAMVVPNAVLDREQYGGFRRGLFPDPSTPIRVEFAEPWDLRRVRPHLFPRGSAVVFGKRSRESMAMPSTAQYWSGHGIGASAAWPDNRDLVDRVVETVPVFNSEYASPYRDRFSQGAVCVPRVLFTVNEEPAGPLGVRQGHCAVKSRRSAYEKKPWKDLDDLSGVVESEFVRPLLLGETVLPYRLRPPQLAVVPWSGKKLLHGGTEGIGLYPGLSAWWLPADFLA